MPQTHTYNPKRKQYKNKTFRKMQKNSNPHQRNIILHSKVIQVIVETPPWRNPPSDMWCQKWDLQRVSIPSDGNWTLRLNHRSLEVFSCQSASIAGMKSVAADTVAMVTYRSVFSLKMFHLWDFAFLFSYWGQDKKMMKCLLIWSKHVKELEF